MGMGLRYVICIAFICMMQDPKKVCWYRFQHKHSFLMSKQLCSWLVHHEKPVLHHWAAQHIGQHNSCSMCLLGLYHGPILLSSLADSMVQTKSRLKAGKQVPQCPGGLQPDLTQTIELCFGISDWQF